MRLLAIFLLVQGLFLFPAAALESEVQRAEFSSSRLIIGNAESPQPDEAAPQQPSPVVKTLDAGVEITLQDGWKTYWRAPGDAGFPLVVEPAATAQNIASIALHWPHPYRFVEEWGLEVFGYKQKVLVPMTITLADANVDTQVDLAVSYAVCSDICINEQQEFSVTVPASYTGNAAHAGLLEKAHAKVPVVNGTDGLTITHVAIAEETEDAGVLHVTATRERKRFSEPELFIESKTAGLRFPKAGVDLGEDGKQVVLAVPYEISLPAQTLENEALTLTLVDGGQAVEYQVTVPPLATGEAAAEEEGAAGAGTASPPDNGSGEAIPAEDTTALPEGGGVDTTLSTMLLLALLGGLVLNIMPCVLPVLSIKLLGAVKHGGRNNREIRQSFIATVAGILVFFMVLAGLTIAAKHAGHAVGWGFHFQSPQFLTFLVVLILLFAANLLGWFEIQLPEWLNTHIYDMTRGGVMKHRHHLLGDFATGAFAALMATPCTAPFLGTAVGFALARGESEILMIFFMLGFGLALPYIAAAFVPALAARLPKPGAWMLRVKQVMGLLMLTAGAWLLWVIAGQAGLWIAIGVLVLSGLLGAVLHGGGRWRFLRRSTNVAALCVALVVTLALLPSLDLSPYQEKHPIEAGTAELWQHFDRARIAGAVEEGKVVFVDVTADWCLTCKFNKLRVLEQEEIIAALQAGDVLAMRADMTRPMPDIQEYLKSYGRYGIPFNIIYGPAAKDGIPLSEVLTVEEVLAALTTARGA